MAITTNPTYPVAGDEIELAITGATGQTAATRFELTSVPDRSGLEPGMLLNAAGEPVQAFTADAAGAYGVKAYDYRRYSGVPAFAGDPGGWHFELDPSNLPIVAKASSTATGLVLLADMRRVWAAHIATTTDNLHKLVDSGAAMPANSALTAAIIAILDFFASTSPSTPTGENPATTAVVARYGFELAA